MAFKKKGIDQDYSVQGSLVSLIPQRGTQNLVFKLLVGIAIVGSTFLSALRMLYGSEITDEVFAISEASLVTQGAIPFVNNWTQTPGFSVFNMGFVWLYKSIVGSYEGIFLFSRVLFLISNIFFAGIIAMLLRRTGLNMFYSALTYIVIIPYFYLIPNFTYNSISLFLLRIIGILLYVFLERSGKYLNCLWFIGMLCALDIYCHPSDVVAIVMITVFLLFYYRKKIRKWLVFCVGGGMAALGLTFWMIIKGGGIYNLIYGLNSVLKYNPYFELGHTEISEALKNLFNYTKDILCLGVLLLIVYLLSYCMRRRIPVWVNKFCFLFFGTLYILFGYVGHDLLCKLGTLIAVYLIGLTPSIIRNKRTQNIYIFTVIPVLFATVVLGLFSYGNITSRLAMMASLAYVIIVDISTWDMRENWKKVVAFSTTILMVLCVLKADYTYIYRDDSMNNLKYKVESGVYKGIYTTKERAELLPKIQNYLQSFLTEEDEVLFMEVVPFAYLMTDAQACTPSTWDVSLYTYGFNDDTLYQRYFEIAHKTPNYIIYIDTGRDKHLSVMDDVYNFTQYVKKNYTKKYDDVIGEMNIITYERDR